MSHKVCCKVNKTNLLQAHSIHFKWFLCFIVFKILFILLLKNTNILLLHIFLCFLCVTMDCWDSDKDWLFCFDSAQECDSFSYTVSSVKTCKCTVLNYYHSYFYRRRGNRKEMWIHSVSAVWTSMWVKQL